MVKLVIFDLDGVLTSTSIEHFSAWKQIMKKHFGLEIENSVEEKTKGVSRMVSLERILESIDKQGISHEAKLQLAKEKNELYVELIQKYDEEYLFEGVLELFEELQNHKIKIALGSASKNASNIVRNLGIYEMFDYIVDPSNVPGKPNPDIFLDAAQHLRIDPSECVGVEDAQAGIDAINSAGMISIGIVLEGDLTGCDYKFDEVKDIDFSIFTSKK